MTTNATLTAGPNDHTVDLFASNPISEGTIRYGNWYDRLQSKGSVLLPAALTGSDYSGSLVERSNHKVWSETFAAGEGVWWADVCGGHSTFAIAIEIAAVPADALTEVVEFLDGLHDYPIADDDVHSALEMEAQGEAWVSWGRREFVSELEKTHNVDLSDVADDKIDALFETALETANEYWSNQQGSDCYINIGRVVLRGVSDDDVAELLKSEAA